MAISVGVARPTQTISGVGNANPGRISGVSVARPTGNVSVGRDYGLQGFGAVPYASQPQSIRVGPAPKSPAVIAAEQQTNALRAMVDAYARQLSEMRRRTAPSIDYIGINNRARSAAEQAVNPRYTLLLNQFLKGQAEKRGQRQGQYDINIKNLEDELKTALEGSEIKRGRTSEDVAGNLEQLATAEDEFQTDAGQEFEADRIALASDLASRGLTTSGQGMQEAQQAQEQQFTGEERQVKQYAQQKAEQNLFKNRTFEDLFRGDELSKVTTEKGKQAEKFDLDNYIKNAQIEEENFKITNENARLDAVSSEADRQSRALTMAWVQSIQDPITRQAAMEAYL